MVERVVRIGRRSVGIAGLALAMVLGASGCGGDKESSKTEPASEPVVELTPSTIRAELIKMLYAQEENRNISDSMVETYGWGSQEATGASRHEHMADSMYMARLDSYVQKYGWPGRSIVGDEASLGAFLIVQHASVDFQERYLPMLQEEVEKNEFGPPWLAMLKDRVRMRRQQPQIYGTQLWNDPSTGDLALYPIEDSAGVDARRQEVGLPPLDEYLKQMGVNTVGK